MISQADQNDERAKYSGPGGWNNPGMLQVGIAFGVYNTIPSHRNIETSNRQVSAIAGIILLPLP